MTSGTRRIDAALAAGEGHVVDPRLVHHEVIAELRVGLLGLDEVIEGAGVEREDLGRGAGRLHRAVSSLTQMLSGVPQKRSRDRAQSTLLRRKSPKRPSLMCSGSQWIAWLLAMAWPISARRADEPARPRVLDERVVVARQQKG
jgi:hypothetical protein